MASSFSNNGIPRDGPATTFQSDEAIRALMEANEDGFGVDDETYGLVLVAGWPAPAAWQQLYGEEIRPRLSACFPNDTSSVYIYPPEALHVTLATFWSFHRQEELSSTHRKALEHHVHRVVERAWQNYLDDYPRENNFVLDIQSAQMGAKAGILLWKESTGRLDAFRAILRQTCQEECEQLVQRGINSDNDSITEFLQEVFSNLILPNIVHSTVVRFAATPRTDGAMVQDLFRRTLLDELAANLIPQSIPLESITLVCEKKPYMHVPQDEDHVLWTAALSGTYSR